MASTSRLVVESPLFVMQMGRIVTSGVTPSTPMPLPTWAAMTPATKVPCQPSTPPAVPARLQQSSRLAWLKSGWAAYTPESMTATVTPSPRASWLPALSVWSQAAWAFTASRFH